MDKSEIERREKLLTEAMCSEPGKKLIADSIKNLMIGKWRPGNGLTCYSCGSENIEIQLGALEHWSGLRRHCFDCDHRSYGLQSMLRGYTIVEKLDG